MNKEIGIPSKGPEPSLGEKILWLFEQISFLFWKRRFSHISYLSLVEKSALAIEEILEQHDLKNKYRENINFSAIIESRSYWNFEISKEYSNTEDSIIMILSRKESIGQLNYSITFETKEGKILGIKSMNQGFSIERYFNETGSDYLDPTVLAALRTASASLKRGQLTKVLFSNQLKIRRSYFQNYDDLANNSLELKIKKSGISGGGTRPRP